MASMHYRVNSYQMGRLDKAFIRAHRVDSLTQQASCCKYCYEPLTVRTATADHKKAKARGGNNSRTNIVAACNDCNSLKGSLSTQEFMDKIFAGDNLNFLLIRFRRTLWRRTHLARKRISRAAGLVYSGPKI